MKRFIAIIVVLAAAGIAWWYTTRPAEQVAADAAADATEAAGEATEAATEAAEGAAEAEGLQRRVEPAREGPSRALRAKAEAPVTDLVRGGGGKGSHTYSLIPN